MNRKKLPSTTVICKLLYVVSGDGKNRFQWICQAKSIQIYSG